MNIEELQEHFGCEVYCAMQCKGLGQSHTTTTYYITEEENSRSRRNPPASRKQARVIYVENLAYYLQKENSPEINFVFDNENCCMAGTRTRTHAFFSSLITSLKISDIPAGEASYSNMLRLQQTSKPDS